MNIPKHELEKIAQWMLPEIKAYYATEEGQQAFAEWLKLHDTETQAKGKKEK